LFFGCSEKNPEGENEPAQKSGWVSRYWDGCKQSCSWDDGKTQYPPLASTDRCRSCGRDGSTETAANVGSSCTGGNSYTCFDFTPYKVNDNLAYAFAAAPTDQCGKCFELQFDGGSRYPANANHLKIKGKTLIVMTSNKGGDVGEGQFDVLIPGGGVGQFNAFSSQIGVSTSQLGKQYGGLLGTCEEESNYNASTYKQCLTNKCNSVFTDATLKAGCIFLADWFEAAGNPTMLYKEVTCPQYLIDKYKATLK